jgi:hypothetical protein
MFAPHTDPSPVTQVGQRGSSLDRRSNRVFSFPAPIPAGCPGHSPLRQPCYSSGLRSSANLSGFFVCPGRRDISEMG